MPITAAVTKQLDNGQSLEVIGTMTASGDYTTGGDTVAFTGLNIKSTRSPLIVSVKGSGGYFYEFDTANSKLIVRECTGTTNPAAEITGSSAYPSGVTGDSIKFSGIFYKNV